MSTQVIGQLFIQIIRSPARDFIRGWRFSTPDKGALYRIWPPTGFSIPWPGRTMTDHDAAKPIELIRSVVLIIFATVAVGIAKMGDMRRVGVVPTAGDHLFRGSFDLG
jgi:hypothetical protein